MKRIIWVDAYKGGLILLVMLGHALQYSLQNDCFNSVLWNIIYSFHMPAFFALSGMFAHDKIDGAKELGNVIWRRFRQLLVPMICWQILLDIVPPYNQNYSILRYLDCGSFWFLWVLFFISLIYSLVCYLSQIFKLPPFLLHIGVSIILYFILVLTDYKEHGFHYLAYYYPYYVLGKYLHRSSNVQSVKTVWLWGLVACWFVLSLFWRMHEPPLYLNWLQSVPKAIIITANRYFVGILGVIAMGGVAKTYLEKEGGEMNNWLTFLGTTSLALYTIHVSLFEIGRKNNLHWFDNDSIETIITMLIFLFVSSLLVCLIKKNKWSSMFLLGKFK